MQHVLQDYIGFLLAGIAILIDILSHFAHLETALDFNHQMTDQKLGFNRRLTTLF